MLTRSRVTGSMVAILLAGIALTSILVYTSQGQSRTEPDTLATDRSKLTALLQGRIVRPDVPGQPTATSSKPRYTDQVDELLALTGHIVFNTDRDGTFDLYTQNADGSSPSIPLVAGLGDDITPMWSPDGTQLVFASDRDGDFDIYLRTVDGKEVKLTQNTDEDGHPSWSPAGDRILFTSNRTSSYYQIYTMRTDGTDVQRVGIVPDNNAMYPHYSPDGNRITFMRASVTEAICQWNWDVWVMDADGENQQRVTTHLGGDLYPRWTPDGTEIVYASCRNLIDSDLYAKNPDTEVERQITSQLLSNEWAAIYSPDAEHIAYNTDVDGNIEIYMMPAAGGTAWNFTQNSADDFAASWASQEAPMTYLISGSVTTADHDPILGVTIYDDKGHVDTTDSQGKYTLRGLAPGVYTLTPTRNNYNFSPITLSVQVPPDAAEQNFMGSLVTPDPGLELAERFAPYMYFYYDDIYRPISITVPVEYAVLKEYVDGELRNVKLRPTLADLIDPGWNKKDTFIDLLGDGPKDIRGVYRSGIRPIVGSPLAYVRVYSEPTISDIAIQYWFYYYDNPWTNHHEGDWEMVQVVLDHNRTPKYVAYSQHFKILVVGGGSKRIWNDVEKIGEHPVVYVARGSHASYFKQYDYFAGLGIDTTGPIGLGRNNPIPVQMLPVDEDNKNTWIYFKGRWGSKGGWSPLDQDGPEGPTQQDAKWKHPLVWSDGLMWDENVLSPHNYGKFRISVPAPLDVHVYKLPWLDHVGWKDGQVEVEIPDAEYFDNSESGWRTIILHTVDPDDRRYKVVSGYRGSTLQKEVQATSEPMTMTLHFPDLTSNTVITALYTLTETWSVSTTGVISVYHGSDFHLLLDSDGDGEYDQNLPPTTLDEAPFDFTAPSPITDLAVLTTTTGAAVLTWTAPGDDGHSGTATAYDIRHYTAPITDSNWVSATLVSSPVPTSAGTTELYTVTGVPGGVHYFAIEAIDDMLRYSGLSNVGQADVPYHHLYLPLILRND